MIPRRSPARRKVGFSDQALAMNKIIVSVRREIGEGGRLYDIYTGTTAYEAWT